MKINYIKGRPDKAVAFNGSTNFNSHLINDVASLR